MNLNNYLRMKNYLELLRINRLQYSKGFINAAEYINNLEALRNQFKGVIKYLKNL